MDWQIIISLITLALVIFGIIWGNGLWARREIIKINIHRPSYAAPEDRMLKVFWSYELQRLGGKRVRHAARILLKPDKQTYTKLQQQYIRLPQDGVIMFTNRLPLPREEIVSSYKYGDISEYPEYEAYNGITGIEQWKIIRQLVSELEQNPFEVGLVWEDNPSKKPKWKKIKQEDSGWITL